MQIANRSKSRMALGGLLCSLAWMATGCEGLFDGLSLPPVIALLEPTEGLPGTEVLIRGSGLGSPDVDPDLVLRFGDRELRFHDSDDVVEWGPSRVRFFVPLAARPGEVQVRVVTQHGESNGLTFRVTEPQRGVASEFVGAIAQQDSESVALFKLRKLGPADLRIEDWDSAAGRQVTEVALFREGFRTHVHDLVLDADGQTTLALSRTPLSDATGLDGVDELLVLGDGYVGATTSFETLRRPRRLAAFGLGAAETREIAVLSEGGGAVEFFRGAELRREATLSLASLGADAQPTTGLFVGTGRLLLAGIGAWDPTVSFTALLDRDPAGDSPPVQTLAAFSGVATWSTVLDGAEAVDFATREPYNPATDPSSQPDWRVREWFVAYNPVEGGVDRPGLLRYQISETDTTAIRFSRMHFDQGERIVGMRKSEWREPTEGGSGAIVDFYQAESLWVLIDADDDADDRLVAVHLGEVSRPTFPDSDRSFSAWKAAWFADPITVVVEDDGGQWPRVPFTEIRDDFDGEPAMLNPQGLTILPTGIEGGPTFLMVSSRTGPDRPDHFSIVATWVLDGGEDWALEVVEIPGEGAGPIACYRVNSGS